MITTAGRSAFRDVAACSDPTGVEPRLFFQRVPEGKTSKNRVHLDVHAAEDRKAAEAERLVALGAQVVDEYADRGPRTIVMRDPRATSSACTDGRPCDRRRHSPTPGQALRPALRLSQPSLSSQPSSLRTGHQPTSGHMGARGSAVHVCCSSPMCCNLSRHHGTADLSRTGYRSSLRASGSCLAVSRRVRTGRPLGLCPCGHVVQRSRRLQSGG